MANCNWTHSNCKSETNCKTGGLVKWEPLTEWGIFFSINNHKILRVVIETLSSRGNSRLKSRVVGELPGLDYSLCFLFVWQMLSHLKYSTRHSCLGRCLYYYSVFLNCGSQSEVGSEHHLQQTTLVLFDSRVFSALHPPLPLKLDLSIG